jgi:enoyl-CoA hydratase/carnithine racemase
VADQSHASVSEDGGIITVTIDRQAKRNAISPEVTRVLWEATRALASRPDLQVLVITAVGPYFTAGIDLGAVPGERDGERIQPGLDYRRTFREHHLLYDEFEALEKPIILAAQGHCFGAGVEMAASCDFRFAAEGVTFWLPEIGLGVLPASGGTSRLTRLVGPHWGKWMAMAGRKVDADQARAIGLVHDVFPPEELHEKVDAFARELCDIPADALGMAKLAVDMAADVDRTSARHIERFTNTVLTDTEEWRARTARFRK